MFNIINEAECTDKNRECTDRPGGTEKWAAGPPSLPPSPCLGLKIRHWRQRQLEQWDFPLPI